MHLILVLLSLLDWKTCKYCSYCRLVLMKKRSHIAVKVAPRWPQKLKKTGPGQQWSVISSARLYIFLSNPIFIYVDRLCPLEKQKTCKKA